MYTMSSQKPYLKIFTSEEKSWKKGDFSYKLLCDWKVFQ